jgi:LuxR family maltose regulon positive regulatory protein
VSDAAATHGCDPVHPSAAAKLAPLQTRAGTISRRSTLAGRLRPRPRPTVALVVAPAGYGKTTLLAELTHAAGARRRAWITAGEEDNDPVEFLGCAAVALEQAGVPTEHVDSALNAEEADLSAAMTLLEALLARSGPIAIAVDDLHLVTSRQSLEVVEFLASHLPPHSQLLLASRNPPELELAGLRAEGRVVDVGPEDLRLSEEEAARLLRSEGAVVSDDEVAEVTARTEGWPTGLYLAVLAHHAAGQPLRSFDGSDRLVSEYFHAESLDELPADDVHFLRHASVLDEMSGSICDAVLGLSGSASRLERLARLNLFLIRLDRPEPPAYRFHTLFREALAAELRRTEPGTAEALAGRAADWCERHGDTAGAAEYARRAGDDERFAALIETSALPLYHGGHLSTLERWLAELDEDLVGRHPAIAFYGAVVNVVRGRAAEAERWAAAAAGAPPDTAMPDGSSSPQPWLALLRAAMCEAGVEQMRRDAELALATLGDRSPLRPAALLVLGVSHLLAGAAAEADEKLGDASSAAALAGTSATLSLALAERSALAEAGGRSDAADALAAEACDVVEQARLDDYSTSAMAYAARARSAVRRSDWVRARKELERVHELLPTLTAACPWVAVQVRLEAARAHLELSGRHEAAALLAAARDVMAERPQLGVLGEQADALARDLERSSRADSAWDDLTPAERRLLPLLMTHLTFREIGEFLNISRNTVKTQAISTYRKLGVSSRSEAISRAIRLGFVEKPEVLETAARGAERPRR